MRPLAAVSEPTGEERKSAFAARPGVALGRIMGVPISLDYSWFLVFALLTWILGGSYYPAEFKNWPPLQYWVTGAATAILLFASVLLHELGHSYIAMRFGMTVRSITLYIFGGVAQIGSEPPSAKAEFQIAMAGPAVSVGLAAVFWVVQPALTGIEPLWGMAKYLAFINLALALFNLIPGFPLDGGRVFRALIWAATKNLRKATLIAANTGRFFGFLSAGPPGRVPGVAGRPRGLAGDEYAMCFSRSGHRAAANGGRTRAGHGPALLPGQPWSGHCRPDDTSPNQGGGQIGVDLHDGSGSDDPDGRSEKRRPII
jgi:Zn-dependent protease